MVIEVIFLHERCAEFCSLLEGIEGVGVDVAFCHGFVVASLSAMQTHSSATSCRPPAATFTMCN